MQVYKQFRISNLKFGGFGGGQCTLQRNAQPEPKFLKIFNSAENASAGFQFNCFDIFNDKTLNYRLLDHLSGLLKFIRKIFSISKQKL